MKVFKKSQVGVTLTELMVGMVVGLVVVGAVLQVYLTTVNTSSDTLKMSHLNQELSAMMNIMANDVRRAGYADATTVDWDDPTGADPDDLPNFLEPRTNPFNQVGTTALEVHADDGAGNYADAGQQGNGGCIVYAYDADMDGVLDDDENLGFKLDLADGELKMRRSGTDTDDCANGAWEGMSDGDTVNITNLTFSLANAQCLNTSEPNEIDDDGDGSTDEADEYDCYTVAADSDEATVLVRNVDITLTGELVEDSSVTASLEQRVRVRNNAIQIAP